MFHNPRHEVLFIFYHNKGFFARAIQIYGERDGCVDLGGERYKISSKINITV